MTDLLGFLAALAGVAIFLLWDHRLQGRPVARVFVWAVVVPVLGTLTAAIAGITPEDLGRLPVVVGAVVGGVGSWWVTREGPEAERGSHACGR